MLAAVFHGIGEARLEERPAPELEAADDVRINVLGTGVCGTDRAILRGLFPARPGVILGHEAVGRVDAAGAGVRTLREGDTVIVNPTMFCGRCGYCLRGRTGLCRAKAGTEVGVDRDGTCADQAVLPERFLFRVPGALSVERAVLVEPLACVLNNLRAVAAGITDSVLVLGGGPIGALMALVARRSCRTVTLVEQDAYRAAQCAELVGEVRAPPAGPTEAWSAWADRLPRGRPDVVIDTTGVLLGAAVAAVADGGRVAAMGFNTEAAVSLRNQEIVARALTLVGAGDYDESIFPRALDLALELPLERLVTHRVPLADFGRVAALLGIGGASYSAMKVVVER